MNASFGAQHPLLHRISALIFRPEIGKAMLVLVGLLPAMALLADIHRFAVNVPFMDDWQFVPLLERAMNGTLTFKELWAPHDEHRLLLPRLIIIASMFATHGDYRVQCFITFAVVAIISVCLLWLMVRLSGYKSSVICTWALANIALFSPIQFHNCFGRCNLPTSCLILSSRFAFAPFMHEFVPSRNSYWQPSSRWLATSVSCKAT